MVGMPVRVRNVGDGVLTVPAVAPPLNDKPGGTLPPTVQDEAALWAPIALNTTVLVVPTVAVVGLGDEALSVVNDTRFGLTSGIVTTNLARATHFRRNAKTGCVMVNLPTAGTDYHVPFGGRGESSYGPREQGSYAAEFYTAVKTAYISSGMPA